MRLYYGGYGHNPSGKQYVYCGRDNYRTGQNVVAPVTRKRKDGTVHTYNTMFTIMRTGDADKKLATNEEGRLSQGGIGIKFIKGRDLLKDLATGKELTKIDENVTAKDWADMSEVAYKQKTYARLNNVSMGQAADEMMKKRLLGMSV